MGGRSHLKSVVLSCSTIVALVAGLSCPATAQDTVSADEAVADRDGLTPIVVTARKREERLQDVPLAISAFSGDALEESGITDSKELFDSVPNFNFVRQGAYVPMPVVRGVYAGVRDPTSEPSIGFYINDVYIPSANQLDMNLLDVERIEVLRGPQGTIYGKNSLGGAVKIITRAPSDEFEARGRFSYGNRNRIEASLGLSGPIVQGLLTARIAGTIRQSDGFLYNDVLDKKVEYDDYKGLVVAFRLTPSPEFTADLSVDIMRSKPSSGNQETFEASFLESCRAAAVGVLLPGCPAFAAGFGYTSNTVAHDGIVSRDIESTQNMRGEGVSLTARYDFGAMELVSVSSFRSFRTYMEEDRDGSAYPIVFPFSQDYKSEAWSQELRLSSTGSGPLQWTVGLYGFKDQRDLFMIAGSSRPGVFSVAAPAALIAPVGPFPTGTRLALFNAMLQETTDLSSNSKAIFGQATYEFSPVLSLTVGARQTWEKRDISLFSVCDYNYACPALSANLPDGTFLPSTRPAPSAATDTAKENVFTPLATLSVKPTEDILAYATVSKGFKSGGYAPVFTFSVRPFNSEKAWNYELGLKTSWFDNRLIFNASAFYFDWKDVQINNFTDSAGFVVQNAAGVKNKGLEFDLQAKPFDFLSIGGSYGYLDSKYSGHLAPVCAAGQTSGCSVHQSLRRPAAPQHSFSIYADYNQPISDEWSLNARIDYSMKKGIIHRIDQIGSVGDPTSVNTGRLLLEEDYDLVNARIGLKSDSWGFSLWSRNLFNEKYYSSVSEFAGAVGAAYGFAGDPRAYGIEMSVNF